MTTFDGKTFTLGDEQTSLLLAKDFGRTGSKIELKNGKIETDLSSDSGFEVVEVEQNVWEIRTSPRLYGNVAGALGTIVSRERKLPRNWIPNSSNIIFQSFFYLT